MTNLLELPAEVREKIWKYAISIDDIIICRSVWDTVHGAQCDGTGLDGHHAVPFGNPNCGLILASRRTNEESKPYCPTMFDVRFATLWCARGFLNT